MKPIPRRTFLAYLASTILGCNQLEQEARRVVGAETKRERRSRRRRRDLADVLALKEQSIPLHTPERSFDEGRVIEIINSKRNVGDPNKTTIFFGQSPDPLIKHDRNIQIMVNELYRGMFGEEINRDLSYIYTDLAGGEGGIGGRYWGPPVDLVAINHFLDSRKGFNILLHEVLGHSRSGNSCLEGNSSSEAVAEFSALYGGLQSLVLFPVISVQTYGRIPSESVFRMRENIYRLLENEQDNSSDTNRPYEYAAVASLLSLIKNNGNARNALNDLSCGYVGDSDVDWYLSNNPIEGEVPIIEWWRGDRQGTQSRKILVYEELKSLALGLWYEANREQLDPRVRETSFRLGRKQIFVPNQQVSVQLPPGILVPTSYDVFVERSDRYNHKDRTIF